MEKIFLFQFKYNHVQGMKKMHSVYKKLSIHFFSEVTQDLAQLLIQINKNTQNSSLYPLSKCHVTTIYDTQIPQNCGEDFYYPVYEL